MADIAGLPYATVEFKLDAEGKLQTPTLPAPPAGTQDLIIISHGWHMDAADSQKLYETLVGNLVAVDGGGWVGSGRKVAVWGVFWPSDRFRDDLGRETAQVLGGGAQAAGGDLHLDVLKAQAREIGAFLGVKGAALDSLVKLAALATDSDPDADDLASLLREAVGAGEPVDAQTALDHKELLGPTPGHKLVAQLKVQPAAVAAALAAGGGAAAGFTPGGGAAGGQAQGFFSGAVAGVAKLLNQFAYYELKKRAGAVGERLGGLLDADPRLAGVRIHLVGHSFGGRLVTAAALAMPNHKVQSMTLLQAAFSHNSFGANLTYGPYSIPKGGFREVITGARVKGPIAISHTWRDEAVGLAYPAASRVSQTIANALQVSDNFGGPKDVFGGLGSNGALGLTDAERTDLVFDGVSALALAPGRVTNIKCDAITEHNDVARIECARILHAAMS